MIRWDADRSTRGVLGLSALLGALAFGALSAGCEGGCQDFVVDGATNIPASERAQVTVRFCAGTICHDASVDSGDPPVSEVQVTVGDPSRDPVGGGVLSLSRGESTWLFHFSTPSSFFLFTLEDAGAGRPIVQLDHVATDRVLENCGSVTVDAGPRRGGAR